jgi:hypothetical protein
MKRIFSILALACSAGLFAQTAPVDAGFENWTNRTWYFEPTGFLTDNGDHVFRGAEPAIERVTDAHSGKYAVRIHTRKRAEDTLYGTLYIGTPGSYGNEGGRRMRHRPEMLRGYMKADLKGGEAFVIVFVRDDQGQVLGIGSNSIDTDITAYEEFSIRINWFDPDPDVKAEFFSFAAISGSSNLESQIPGSNITLDSLWFESSDTAIFENGDFENWDSLVTMEPLHWTSSNYESLGNDSTGVTISSDAYHGNHSVAIVNRRGWDGQINGYVSNQRRVAGSMQLAGGLPVNNNPGRLKGYYKYFPQSGDRASIHLTTYQGDGTVQEDTIHSLGAAANWTPFTCGLTYFGSDTIDEIAVALHAGDLRLTSAGPRLGSLLLVDSLSIEYGWGMGVTYLYGPSISLFPNPAANDVKLVPGFNGKYNMLLSDLSGRTILATHGNEGEIRLPIGHLPTGMYHVRIQSASGTAAYPLQIAR